MAFVRVVYTHDGWQESTHPASKGLVGYRWVPVGGTYDIGDLWVRAPRSKRGKGRKKGRR